MFLKDYWPFPSPRKDSQISFLSVSFRGSWISRGGSEVRREVSEREKNKEEEKERVYHPLPFPLAVFPVRISLHRPNNLDAWKHFTSFMCTPSKQFASKCFSPFYFKQKFKGNCLQNSLRGRRLKGKGKGILGARGAPLAFLSHLKLPFPSLSNACHGGYGDVEWTKVRFEIRTSYISDPAGKNTNEDSKWRLQDRRMLFYFPNGVTQCSLRRVTRKFWSPFIPGERSTAKDTLHWFVWIVCSVGRFLACEKIRFSSPFTAGEVSREKSPAAKSEMEKRMFSQAPFLLAPRKGRIGEATMTGVSPTRH